MPVALLPFALSVLASLGTFLGGLLVVLLSPLFPSNPAVIVGHAEAFAAGVMVFMSLADLLPEALHVLPLKDVISWFLGGLILFASLEKILHQFPKSSVTSVTFIALALHNLPEGLSVYLSALANFQLGLELTIGILLHNVPEGIAVALPMWIEKKSTWSILSMTMINGLAEPAGVLIGALIMGPALTPEMVSGSLAAVAGLMVCISFIELLPSATKLNTLKWALVSFFTGIFICWGMLEAIPHLFEKH